MGGYIGRTPSQVNQEFLRKTADASQQIWKSKMSPEQKEAVFRGLGHEIIQDKFIAADVKRKALESIASGVPAGQRDAVMDRLLAAHPEAVDSKGNLVQRGKVTTEITSTGGKSPEEVHADFLKELYSNIVE